MFSICHVWYEENEQVPYNGKIVKVKGKGNKQKYVVSYWSATETLDDATDCDMSIFALAADFILSDLTI